MTNADKTRQNTEVLATEEKYRNIRSMTVKETVL